MVVICRKKMNDKLKLSVYTCSLCRYIKREKKWKNLYEFQVKFFLMKINKLIKYDET